MVPSVPRTLDLADFRSAMHCKPALAPAWAADLDRRVKQARFCIEVHSLRKVRVWLDAWPPAGPLQVLAAEIGMTREALYRKFARRRRDQSAVSVTKTASLRTSVVFL